MNGGDAAATVVTALDLAPYRSSADTLLWGSLILDAVMLVCAYVLTRLAVGRALRPVRTMTDQATQWSAVASETRFNTGSGPVELARLGTSLDALLDRIRAVLRHEQQLTGSCPTSCGRHSPGSSPNSTGGGPGPARPRRPAPLTR
ncbi:hypothetical protein SVIO_023270 [Streptomyces violaceusniger]|uniref:histidine kinase n=1 Tax=Streptomyces violaceusniger TaxID=68280 RepID=A0A4D4KU59_STRVO|nr:hypothetical protein SVIO_023270 [Streptomyces violaceusniger]